MHTPHPPPARCGEDVPQGWAATEGVLPAWTRPRRGGKGGQGVYVPVVPSCELDMPHTHLRDLALLPSGGLANNSRNGFARLKIQFVCLVCLRSPVGESCVKVSSDTGQFSIC